MSKISPQTKSFIFLFGLAIVGTYLCVMLWPDMASFTYKSYSYRATPAPNNINNELAAEPPPLPAVDTSSWKDYTNAEFGFSFKYNPDWKIKTIQQKKDFNVLEIDPGPKYYNIKVYVSPKEFYVMDGLPAKDEIIDGRTAFNVSNLLYGIKTEKYYYTFDVGLSTSLAPNFSALVHSVKFQ